MTVKNGSVESEIFLQNDFLSIGVNAFGGLGSTKYAPSNIKVDTANGYRTVGLLADTDGFDAGKVSPLRDAILRGVAIEGFNIGYKIAGKTIIQSNQQLDGLTEIAGTTKNASSASVGKAEFHGQTTEKLKVDQTISLVDGAKYLRVDVTLTNMSAAAMADLRYMRTADPDHGATMSTDNRILQQGKDGALVASYASANSSPYFLYSADSRAVASTYGFINESPYAAAAYDTAQSVGYKAVADQSINLTFGLGTLAAGGSTTVTFYMGVTNDVLATVAAIDKAEVPGTSPPVQVPVAAPDAVNDAFSVVAGETASGNVLANDTDAAGRTLSASLKSGPAHGTLKLAADGSFSYVADKGYVGSDSFSYAASADGQSDTAVVKVTATAPPVVTPSLPDSPTIGRAGTLNGSASTADILTGVAGANSFYFDVAATSGKDRITNFGSNDVLVTKGALLDGNGDGKITYSKGTLSFDEAKIDQVKIDGVSALRTLGQDRDGLYVYGEFSTRPTGAIEGTLANNALSGDVSDKKAEKFFFDTALGLNLGSDTLANFGVKDILVTTSALSNDRVGGLVELTSGVLKLSGSSAVNLGSVEIDDRAGNAVGVLEYDGSVVRDGTTYYVYSHDGSAAGLATLGM